MQLSVIVSSCIFLLAQVKVTRSVSWRISATRGGREKRGKPRQNVVCCCATVANSNHSPIGDIVADCRLSYLVQYISTRFIFIDKTIETRCNKDKLGIKKSQFIDCSSCVVISRKTTYITHCWCI